MGTKKAPRKNRYKKRAPQERRRWGGRLLTGLKLVALMALVLAISALFVAGYAAVTRASYFETHAIQVSGNQRLSRQAVLIQSGIAPGDNMLAVNLRLVRKRLLAHPWIEAARVAREIPETIIIEVKEHTPLAVVDMGQRFLLDDKGRIFKEQSPDDPQALPLVTGIGYADISLGDDAPTPAVATVLDVLAASRGTAAGVSYEQIRKVDLDPEMGITLTAWKEGRRIRMGFADYASKYQRLRQLLPHLKRNREWCDFQSIDVNDPDRVVVQLGTAPRAGA